MMATGWAQAPQTTAKWTRVTAQWLAVVGPPIAAFAQQQLAYYFVSPACTSRAPILLHVPTLVMLGLIAAATMYSRREWTRERDRSASDNGQVGSGRFFALLGLAMGSISIVLLLAQWLPTLFVSPCPP